MKQCRHYYISGKVQGVCYRATVFEQAQQLEVQGWVRNLPDGRVECLGIGSEENLEALQACLQQGSSYSRVTHIEVKERPLEDIVDFTIR